MESSVLFNFAVMNNIAKEKWGDFIINELTTNVKNWSESLDK